MHPTSKTRCLTIHTYEEKRISFQGYVPLQLEIQIRQGSVHGEIMRRQLECNYGFLWCFSTGMMIMFLQIWLVPWGSGRMSSSQGISCWRWPCSGLELAVMPHHSHVFLLKVKGVFEMFPLIMHAISDCLLRFMLQNRLCFQTQHFFFKKHLFFKNT